MTSDFECCGPSFATWDVAWNGADCQKEGQEAQTYGHQESPQEDMISGPAILAYVEIGGGDGHQFSWSSNGPGILKDPLEGITF